MKKVFRVNNINCQNCANTIKVSLEDDFGTINVDLTKNPKELTVELADDVAEEQFKKDMAELGFEVIEEIQ